MADQSERLAAVQRFERSVNDLATRFAFGHTAPEDGYRRDGPHTLAGDLMLIRSRSPEAQAARERLDASGLISRAVANTTTGDVPGILQLQTFPAHIVEQIDRRSADALALIDAITIPLQIEGGLPWVPQLAPPVPAPRQTAEKTEVSSRTVAVAGGQAPVYMRSVATDISQQNVSAGADDAILRLLGEDVIAGCVDELLDAFDTAAGAAATDLAGAVAAVEGAGWSADVLIASRSTLLGAGAITESQIVTSGLRVLPSAQAGGRTYIVATGGVWAQVSPETRLVVSEPSLAGLLASAGRLVTCTVGAGAVEVVGTR
jgi:hypothetical protein